MKITRKQENGEYVTYEGVGEYLNGRFLEKYGCTGCCLAVLAFAAIVVGLFTFLFSALSDFLAS